MHETIDETKGIYYKHMMVIDKKTLAAISIASFTAGGAVGLHAGKSPGAANLLEPDIAIRFDDPAYAEKLRRSNELDQDLLTSACRDAAENYIRFGLSGSANAVTVVLPTREALERARQMPKRKTPVCEP